MKKNQEPTCVKLVFEILVSSDDFRTITQLIEQTRCAKNTVFAAVFHLHKHKAINFLSTGFTTYWYATPDTDNRLTTLSHRKIEDKPRKLRKASPKKGDPGGKPSCQYADIRKILY